MAYLQDLTNVNHASIDDKVPESGNKKRYGKYINLLFLIVEIVLINVSFVLIVYSKSGNLISFIASENLIFGIIYNSSWVFFSSLLDRIKVGRILSIFLETKKSLAIVLLHFLTINAITQFLSNNSIQDSYFITNYFALFILIIVTRSISILLLKEYRSKGYNYKNIVIVGNGQMSYEIHKTIVSNPSFGYKYHGAFSQEDKFSFDVNRIGEISSLFDYCIKNNINEIFCTVSLNKKELINELMHFADNNLIRFRIIPDLGDFVNKNVEISFIENLPLISTRHEPLEKNRNRILKRVFDVVFSLFVIVLIFPFIFPLLSLLVKISSKGSVFFKQLRSGKNNTHFYCYKFRTMRINDYCDKLQAIKNDGRVTSIGRIMRKTNLDELPQFFNVLKGEMSVVGPRPHMLLHTEEYSKIINKYMVRHFVKPGITGWAQANGYRGNTEDRHLMEKRIQHDMWYLENWSIWLDIKIVLMTTFNILKGEKNAY